MKSWQPVFLLWNPAIQKQKQKQKQKMQIHRFLDTELQRMA